MPKDECPCRHCNKRTITCHSTCAGYTKWAKENEEERNKRYEANRLAYISLPYDYWRKH